MLLLLFLSTTVFGFSSKEETRMTYPEIWAKLQEMGYEYKEPSFLLENKDEIVYSEPVKQDHFLCLKQNHHPRVSPIYSKPICGLPLEHF